jgi:hypothetical protein
VLSNPRKDAALAPDEDRAPSAIERIALAKVADLDTLFDEREIRAAADAFAPSYVLVALPKSSSTFCAEVLAATLNATVYKDIVIQDRFTPKDLSIAGIVNCRNRMTLSQVHLVATGANLRILRRFRIPVAILLRNLLDMVVSLRDHMNANPYFSSILIPNDWNALSETDKLDYIIDTAVPWTVTFYVSWARAIARGDVDTALFHYEEMLRAPVPFFRNICACFGCSVSDDLIERSLARVEKSEATRFNVGRTGRGREELSAAQIARIRRHQDYYPGIDFAPLGL